MNDPDISIVMIAAVARNGVIGVNGDMPWRIPSDFAHFKRTTMGKPMIMGRKQFETLGKPLPGRVNIVVSRQRGYQPEGVIVINDFAASIEHGRTIAKAQGVDEVMIIGGGEIYRLGMEIADRLVISHVDLDIDMTKADRVVLFPELSKNKWRLEQNLPVTAAPKDDASYTIKVYHRNDG